MRVSLTLLIGLLLPIAPVLAQSLQSLPLRENTPSPETTVTRPSPNLSPNEARSAGQAPEARNRSDGRVAPPSAIDTPVQIIAPERRP